jgi:hypothetical protein
MTLNLSLQRRLLGAVVSAALLSSACQRGPACYPTRGQVLVGGKPAEGARVLFFPVDADPADLQTLKPSAKVGPDGSFTLRTFFPPDGSVKDGAPAGEYVVTITWVPENLDPDVAGRSSLEAVDRLQGRYGDARKTELRAVVKEGPTDLPPITLPGSAARPDRGRK